jgi:SAM-dependent methyltransferase
VGLTVLDCACGLNPVEGVNDAVHVDLFRTYEGRKNCADVIADAHFLPFVDGAFTAVFSAHTLEHCENPRQVLKEFHRVGKVLVIKGHLFSWSSKTFYQLLRSVYGVVKLTGHVHWKIRGYARVHGIGLKQLAILKTLLFVLVLGEKNELEAICFK